MLEREERRGTARPTPEALVLLANQVLDWDFHVFECHIGSSTAPDTLAVHSSGTDAAVLTLDQEHAYSGGTWAASSNGGREVVTPDTIRNPLLLAIDDIMLAILSELCFTGQVGDIATGVGLGDCETDALVAG